MITEDKVTEIFCNADDFCKVFDAQMEKYTIKSNLKRKYHRESTMSKAEIMVVIILFHSSGFRCLKHFYKEYVCVHLRHLFPNVVSYNRFVELQKTIAIPLTIFIKKVLLGKCTGISFVDSTPLRVCRNQRILIHKTFKGIAQRGKCSMGWFFGFKLHLICNEKGELLNFMITPGDIDDRKPLEYKAFVDFIYGKLVGDKGYIGKNRLRGKVLGMFFLFHSILYLCIMNMLEQLARLVLPKEILDNFDIVKIETDESDIDSMSLTIHLDERMNAYLQKSEDYESKGFMDAVRITDFPIRDHKVILVLRRRRWKNKETGETFVDRISVTESGTRYSKEFAAFLKETYGHIPDDLPYA